MPNFLNSLYRAIKYIGIAGSGVVISMSLLYKLSSHDIYKYERVIKTRESSIEYRIDIKEHRLPLYFVTGNIKIKVNDGENESTLSFSTIGESESEVVYKILEHLLGYDNRHSPQHREGRDKKKRQEKI